MTTIHIIEDEKERALVKRIFRQRMECVAEGAMDLSHNAVGGDMNINDNGSVGCLFGDGAIVYDIIEGGDPDLGWIVYDFRGDGRCYTIAEQDLAGLVNSLPCNVFPF